VAELSFSEIESLVRAALVKAHPGASYAWCRDVYPGSVIYTVEVPVAGGSSQTEPGNGVYYRRTFGLTEGESGYEVTLGKAETVTTKREYQTVKAFSLAEFSANDEYVTYRGRIFEAGDYPDKGVSFTPAELVSIADAFLPVPNDLEHSRTILSDKLGELPVVRAMDGGAWLYGELAIPKWLHELTGSEPIGVSLAFDSEKRIVGNALTLNPRIKSAQVAAAFTEFAGKRNSSRDQADLQKVHDLAVSLGAQCGTEYTAHPPKEKKPMKLGEFISKLFSGGGNVDLEQEIDTGGAPDNTFTQADPEKDRLRAELAKARESQIKAEAVKFTDELVRDRRILPAQAPTVQAMFSQAAADDIKSGGASFSDDGVFAAGDRVKAVRDAWTTAPQHSLTQEQLKGAGVVFADKPESDKPAINPQAIYDARQKAAGGV